VNFLHATMYNEQVMSELWTPDSYEPVSQKRFMKFACKCCHESVWLTCFIQSRIVQNHFLLLLVWFKKKQQLLVIKHTNLLQNFDLMIFSKKILLVIVQHSEVWLELFVRAMLFERETVRLVTINFSHTAKRLANALQANHYQEPFQKNDLSTNGT